MSDARQPDYGFSVAVAARYGLLEAVLLRCLQVYIQYARADGRERQDGRIHVHFSARALAELHPYASPSTLSRALGRLTDKEVLLSRADLNAHPYDRTLWYAFKDESEWLPPQQPVKPIEPPASDDDANCKKEKPISDKEDAERKNDGANRDNNTNESPSASPCNPSSAAGTSVPQESAADDATNNSVTREDPGYEALLTELRAGRTVSNPAALIATARGDKKHVKFEEAKFLLGKAQLALADAVANRRVTSEQADNRVKQLAENSRRENDKRLGINS